MLTLQVDDNHEHTPGDMKNKRRGTEERADFLLLRWLRMTPDSPSHRHDVSHGLTTTRTMTKTSIKLDGGKSLLIFTDLLLFKNEQPSLEFVFTYQRCLK